MMDFHRLRFFLHDPVKTRRGRSGRRRGRPSARRGSSPLAFLPRRGKFSLRVAYCFSPRLCGKTAEL